MDKMKPVFQALNKELIQENLTLTIICVDGYVLEYHGLRATQDVDAGKSNSLSFPFISFYFPRSKRASFHKTNRIPRNASTTSPRYNH